MFYRIEMLKAGRGDSFWIECGEDPDHPTTVIAIDGGSDKELLTERMQQSGPPVDLWIISHTDEDHINGVLPMNSRCREINEVWFNAPSLEGRERSNILSYAQGDELVTILNSRKTHTHWNKSLFEGGSIQVTKTSAGRSTHSLERGNVKVRVLGPTPEDVDALYLDWRSRTLGEEEPPPSTPARPGDLTIEDIDRLASEGDPRPDRRVTNRASIIVLIEFKVTSSTPRHRYLFPGDAPAKTLMQALQKIRRGNKPIRLNGFKLSHHGSSHSFSRELLGSVDCSDFYISTDGSKYNHPHDSTIAKLLRNSSCRRLFFNYADIGERYKAFESDNLQICLPGSDPRDCLVVAEHPPADSRTTPITAGKYWWKSRTYSPPPDRQVISIRLSPHQGNQVKVSLEPPSGERLDAWVLSEKVVTLLNDGAATIRDVMSSLAARWPSEGYFRRELAKAADAGQSLYSLLLDDSPRAQEILKQAQPKQLLVFHSVPEVTISASLIHSPDLPAPDGFWAHRYSLLTPLDYPTPSTDDHILDWFTYVGCPPCEATHPVEFDPHYDNWQSFRTAVEKSPRCLSHFYCHNKRNGTLSTIEGRDIDAHMLNGLNARRRKLGPDVLFLNACDTWRLQKESSMWEFVLKNPPIQGVICTEAPVYQKAADHFAATFSRQLRTRSSLAEAFERAAAESWPAGLFYRLCMPPQFAHNARLSGGK